MMDFRFTEEEEAFRKEVIAFLKQELPPDWRGVDPDMYEDDAVEEVHQLSLKLQRKLGAKGWLGMEWPKKYGGQEAPLMMQVILEEELCYRGAVGYDTYAAGVGPLILQFGTEEQKMKHIPPMCRGEVRWQMGMSEPNAGSDLFSLKTRAVEEEDCFVINGQKTWQSGAGQADWSILYALTDPDAPKGRGVSVLLVDLKTPGITMSGLTHMTGLEAFNEVFYDNVRVPKENLLGERNGGRTVVMGALYTERAYGLSLTNNARRYLELLAEYCRETIIDGQPLGKNRLIRNKLAQIAIEVEIGRLMAHRLCWEASERLPAVVSGSQVKIYGGRLAQRVARVGIQILGTYGQLDQNSKWVKLRGRFKQSYLNTISVTIAGGTSEVAKNAIVGRAGLGLPKG